jgi:hypothetical protein
LEFTCCLGTYVEADRFDFFGVFDRVTKLGEFSPIGRLFTLGRFLNYRRSPHFRPTLYLSIEYLLILTINGWAKLWVIFSHQIVYFRQFFLITEEDHIFVLLYTLVLSIY